MDIRRQRLLFRRRRCQYQGIRCFLAILLHKDSCLHGQGYCRHRCQDIRYIQLNLLLLGIGRGDLVFRRRRSQDNR